MIAISSSICCLSVHRLPAPVSNGQATVFTVVMLYVLWCEDKDIQAIPICTGYRPSDSTC